MHSVLPLLLLLLLCSCHTSCQDHLGPARADVTGNWQLATGNWQLHILAKFRPSVLGPHVFVSIRLVSSPRSSLHSFLCEACSGWLEICGSQEPGFSLARKPDPHHHITSAEASHASKFAQRKRK